MLYQYVLFGNVRLIFVQKAKWGFKGKFQNKKVQFLFELSNLWINLQTHFTKNRCSIGTYCQLNFDSIWVIDLWALVSKFFLNCYRFFLWLKLKHSSVLLVFWLQWKIIELFFDSPGSFIVLVMCTEYST